MMELDQQCKDAGITVMNEIGLDPGIDHLYAVKTIEEVHREGGKILSFLSYCGGLVAPECSGNPLGYKFSWSPRGNLLALRSSARFYKDGKIVDVAGPDLMGVAKPYHIYPGFAFVAYPNRDSTVFKERYNIPEAQTVVRGSLRYAGFPEFVKVLVDIGFLSDEEQSVCQASVPWNEATQRIVGAASAEEADLIRAICARTVFKDDEQREHLCAGLRWLGLFSSERITPRGNPLDTLCATLEKKLQYGPGERDLVILQHKFEVELQDGTTQTRLSTLCEYGSSEPDGYSAMARLVGITCAVAVQQVLNGTLADKGILAPMNSRINDPLIEELKSRYGIFCKEEIIEHRKAA